MLIRLMARMKKELCSAGTRVMKTKPVYLTGMEKDHKPNISLNRDIGIGCQSL
jgi:hypothetical protein